MLPLWLSKFHSLFGLKDWSLSNRLKFPVPAIICPTGKAEDAKSDAAFVMSKDIMLLDKFATSLGDISISSNVVFGIFIVSTTKRIPFKNTNSLYVLLSFSFST